MLIFLDLLTGETIELEITAINIINYTEKGIEIEELNGEKYLCKIIETA
ncbi:hypothetical protein ACR77J_07910 [Tissierella praeacuta]